MLKSNKGQDIGLIETLKKIESEENIKTHEENPNPQNVNAECNLPYTENPGKNDSHSKNTPGKESEKGKEAHLKDINDANQNNNHNNFDNKLLETEFTSTGKFTHALEHAMSNPIAEDITPVDFNRKFKNAKDHIPKIIEKLDSNLVGEGIIKNKYKMIVDAFVLNP